MQYLRIGDLLKAHQAVTAESELPGFDFGLLDSAVARPMMFAQYADADIHVQAGALFWALIRNHPFTTGNKRTAVMATAVFYNLNGWRMNGSDIDLLHLAQDAASGAKTEHDVTLTLAGWATPLPV